MNFTSIEGFCGAGGMALGLKNAGFKSLLAFDNNKAAINTYINCCGPEGKVIDASKITGNDILDMCKIKKGDLGLFAGGPPCQGFSLQRRNGYQADKRNDLVYDFFRLVEEILPQSFLLENVVMLGKKRGIKYINDGFERLSKLGYKITYGFINTAYYGLAQTRKRFIAVGVLHTNFFKFPYHTHEHDEWLTVRDSISDLPDCPEDFTEHPIFANHIRCKISDRNLEMISHVPPGGGWRDIPPDLWLDCMKRWDGTSGGWPDVYGRLDWNSQCPTITAGFDSFSRGRYAHPEYNRAITPREAARLQSFPDKIHFFGNRHDVRLQIGNAVPPRVAEIYGIAIKNHFLKRNTVTRKKCTSPEYFHFHLPEKQFQLFNINREFV